MVEFIVLGPHGCGKHRLARALGAWEIFRCAGQYPQHASGAYLDRYGAPEKVILSANAMFSYVKYTDAIFKVRVLGCREPLFVGYVTLRNGLIVPAEAADVLAARVAKSRMSSEL